MNDESRMRFHTSHGSGVTCEFCGIPRIGTETRRCLDCGATIRNVPVGERVCIFCGGDLASVRQTTASEWK